MTQMKQVTSASAVARPSNSQQSTVGILGARQNPEHERSFQLREEDTPV
jgi:hypothetical protein